MKKQKAQAETALVFETLRGESTGRYSGKTLFCLENKPGLWRRIARTGRGLKVGIEGAQVALFGGQIIELLRDKKAEEELAHAGFKIAEAPPEEKKEPDRKEDGSENGSTQKTTDDGAYNPDGEPGSAETPPEDDGEMPESVEPLTPAEILKRERRQRSVRD